MLEIRNTFTKYVLDGLTSLASKNNLESVTIDPSKIQILAPPNPKMGDLSAPLHSYSKMFNLKPNELANGVAAIINSQADIEQFGTITPTGPYVNLKINRIQFTKSVLNKIETQNEHYGEFDKDGKKPLEGRNVMVEFSSPNTNKPLHLGHLRNDALGESVSRILEKAGAKVFRVNLINDRGVHICKSMYAYQLLHEKKGDTPESLGIKSDHFVGQCYVEFEKINKEQKAEIKEKVEELKNAKKIQEIEKIKKSGSNLPDDQIEKQVEFDLKEEFEQQLKQKSDAENQAENLLIKWESGDEATLKLWTTMNEWALNGVKETYKRTGIKFDKFDFEHDTYLKGRDIVVAGLEKGIFFRAKDNSIRVDVSEVMDNDNQEETKQKSPFEPDPSEYAGEESSEYLKNTKVLQRGDGTSLYMTQDIGTAISRHEFWPFNQLVYVVANEQNHHFKCLFYILRKLGYEWANKLYHLSYGLVNLPEGRMKSREGTIVDADDLIDSLHSSALKEMNEKKRDKPLENPDDVAEKLALSALHYYLLNVTPIKDMLFDPKKSLSFKGNTGPYLQYVTSRIFSILSKAEKDGIHISHEHIDLLVEQEEWELVKILGDFPEVVQKSAESLNPCYMTQYIFDVGKIFSRFYEKHPILTADKADVKESRLYLIKCTFIVMKSAMHLVLVPFLDKM